MIRTLKLGSRKLKDDWSLKPGQNNLSFLDLEPQIKFKVNLKIYKSDTHDPKTPNFQKEVRQSPESQTEHSRINKSKNITLENTRKSNTIPILEKNVFDRNFELKKSENAL